MNDSDKIKVAFVGGHVRRWHGEDVVGEERVDSHTWGMLMLIHILHPAPSVALLEAVTFHDSPGEPFSGDIPYGAKKAHPELRAADHAIGARAQAAIGVCRTDLTDDEKLWLAFADQAQAYLFLHRQAAQGNLLIRVQLQAIHDGLLMMSLDGPDWVADAVDAVINSPVHKPMLRSLDALERM